MFSSREPKSTTAYCHHVLGFRKRWVAAGESTNSAFLTPGSFGRWEGCTRSFTQSTSNQWGGRRKIQLLESVLEQPQARDRLSEAGLFTFLMSVCCFCTDVGDLDFKRAAAEQFKLTVFEIFVISNHSLDIFQFYDQTNHQNKCLECAILQTTDTKLYFSFLRCVVTTLSAIGP